MLPRSGSIFTLAKYSGSCSGANIPSNPTACSKSNSHCERFLFASDQVESVRVNEVRVLTLFAFARTAGFGARSFISTRQASTVLLVSGKFSVEPFDHIEPPPRASRRRLPQLSKALRSEDLGEASGATRGRCEPQTGRERRGWGQPWKTNREDVGPFTKLVRMGPIRNCRLRGCRAAQHHWTPWNQRRNR